MILLIDRFHNIYLSTKQQESAKSSKNEGNRVDPLLLELVSQENISGSGRGGGGVSFGHSVAVKSKGKSKSKVRGPNETKDIDQTVSGANRISENSKAEATAKAKAHAGDGSVNRVDDHSPKLKGSRQSSQPLRSKRPQSKINSRPGLNKSPKGEKSANRVDTDPGIGGDVLSFSRGQNRDDNHGEASRKSSKKSSSVGLGVGSGSSNTLGQSPHHPPTNERPGNDHSNKNSQPDLHSPGGSNGGGDNNRGPIPVCLSNCGMRARSSRRECKASIKARSQNHVEECNDFSEIMFDDCAYDCLQARGGGPGPIHPHDRPRWPRPGGGGNGHRPGGKPHHPGERPRSTPGGGNRSDRSRPRPDSDRPGRGDGADDGADNDCSTICWAEDRRIKRRWCDSRSCPAWANDYLQLCIRECHSTDEGSDNDDSRRNPSKSDDSLDPLQVDIVLCKSNCKSNARIKESLCNDSSKDKRKGLGISDDSCSNWADDFRLKCYDDCYKNAKVVEGESIPKEEDDNKSSGNKSKNDAPAKEEPQKAKKEQRQDDFSKAQDITNKDEDSNDSSSDRPWIDNKISDPKATDQVLPPSNTGTSNPNPKPHPHPHLPGIHEDPPSSTQNTEQGSSSNTVDISNNGVDIDSFTVNLSIALRFSEGLETIKIRSNSGSVRADQENLRHRLIIQDGVVRVLRHIMEEELVSE